MKSLILSKRMKKKKKNIEEISTWDKEADDIVILHTD